MFLRRLIPVLSVVALAGCGDTSSARDTEETRTEEIPNFVEPAEPALTSQHRERGPAVAVPEPAPTPQPTPIVDQPAIEPTPAVVNGLSLRRFVMASGVDQREPIVPARFTTDDERIYAFLDVRNESAEERTVQVSFRPPNGYETGHVSLTIPPSVPRWRTWAYSRWVHQPGEWTAVVRDAHGDVIQELPFLVE